MPNQKQFKIYSFFNQKISTLVTIAVILILAIFVGYFTYWQYLEIQKGEIEIVKVKHPKKEGAIEEDKGLVALYRFDGGENYKIEDSSGNQNHGSFHRSPPDSLYPWWRIEDAKSKGGYSLEFNFNNFVEIPDSPSLSFDKSKGTIEMWVQPHLFCHLPFVNYFKNYGKECGPDTYQRLVVDSNWQIELGIDPKGNLYFYPSQAGSKNYNSIKKPLENFRWNHIIVTWDFSKKGVTFYINGEKKKNDIENVPEYWREVAKTGNWQIGGTSLDIPSSFVGLIDEMKIYNRALSEDEARNHYQLLEKKKKVVDESFEVIKPSPLVVKKIEKGYEVENIKLETTETIIEHIHRFTVFYKNKKTDIDVEWDDWCGKYPGVLTLNYEKNTYILFQSCSYGSGGDWNDYSLYLIDKEKENDNLQPVKERFGWGEQTFSFSEDRGFTVIGYKNLIFFVSGASGHYGSASPWWSYTIDVIDENRLIGEEKEETVETLEQ